MAENIFANEGRETVCIMLRDVFKTNFLRSLREMLWDLTGEFVELPVLSELAGAIYELGGGGAKKLSRTV